MTNAETWERLKRPTCNSDYGLSIDICDLVEVISSKDALDADDKLLMSIAGGVYNEAFSQREGQH